MKLPKFKVPPLARYLPYKDEGINLPNNFLEIKDKIFNGLISDGVVLINSTLEENKVVTAQELYPRNQCDVTGEHSYNWIGSEDTPYPDYYCAFCGKRVDKDAPSHTINRLD